MADYREPWQLLPQQGSGDLEPLMTPHDCEGRPVISTFIGYEESEAPDICPKDAERIVACVNVCRGIPTALLLCPHDPNRTVAGQRLERPAIKLYDSRGHWFIERNPNNLMQSMAVYLRASGYKVTPPDQPHSEMVS